MKLLCHQPVLSPLCAVSDALLSGPGMRLLPLGPWKGSWYALRCSLGSRWTSAEDSDHDDPFDISIIYKLIHPAPRKT